MSFKQIARLSVFLLETHPHSASQRFLSHVLYDRNVINIIEQFAESPLLAPLTFNMEKDVNAPNYVWTARGESLCVHPVTEHLWVTDPNTKRLHIYNAESKQVTLVQTLDCKGVPLCVRCSNGGYVFVSEKSPGAVSMYNAQRTMCGRFGEDRLIDPRGIAINNTLQQIIVTDHGTYAIHVFNLHGVFLRTFHNAGVARPGSVCWNESASLVFIYSEYTDNISVINKKTGFCIKTIEKSDELDLSVIRGMIYRADTNEILMSDKKNHRIVSMDCQGNNIHSPVAFVKGPTDIALKPHDKYKQLFIFDEGNYCIHII
jgi:DNA-binding beta-propeller fold protein YncE